ncbi:MAG: class I SAM-dependent methyltransferase [Gemmatimonadetes bacterium]|nr:class I SAM-dependent methyltransferase [Gemmatimonadota bacterium]
MKLVEDFVTFNSSEIPVDSFWNTGEERELKMHRIHGYPAKFPAFITTKALSYAAQQGLTVNRIADVFCGCGTVALEAKRNYIGFWGCDLNPVATLIAKVKSHKYQDARLSKYYTEIESLFQSGRKPPPRYVNAPERLKYWYTERQYCDLVRLRDAIETCTPKQSPYRLFFLCAFSNILKTTSRWLTKSIKPQIDPHKRPTEVWSAFLNQYDFMKTANNEIDFSGVLTTEIVTGDFLSSGKTCPNVDMIITSPPYVTSYEYADLHQLSSLWLKFTKDYRELRKGSIGSLYHKYDYEGGLEKLNNSGKETVLRLLAKDGSKARSVAKYYLDMQKVVNKCKSMLKEGCMALFVIGNTEYKGIRIDNTHHLVESLIDSGFEDLRITKRKISKKTLTPYRDERGRFTCDSSGRKVYSEEFIVIGRR